MSSSKMQIWMPHEKEAWVPVQVISSDTTSVTVRHGNAEIKLPGDLSHYDVCVAEACEKSYDNLVDLEVFNEGIILHQIRQRYSSGRIYTYVGNILVGLNPYQKLNIYTTEIMHNIHKRVKANAAMVPHVFSIAAVALHNMAHDQADQAILISGESGAGKTECCKKLLNFFSSMAGSTASRAGLSVETQILDSNPLLESFGNAKTVRNNNSSRFGKWMEVNFNNRNEIKGCNVVSYLLEKSRVVNQMPTERNYHSFYMLLAGATKDMRADWQLKPADQFHYLAQSGCVEIGDRDDAEEFKALVSSMHNLALDDNIQRQIFQILATILHLGNVTFIPSRDTEGGSQFASPQDSRRIASLLGITSEALEQALCFRDSTFGIGETITIPLDPTKAVDQRDAFAKHIYGRIFDLIVYRINNVLFRGKVGRSIGVLDIFGFEVFKLNSFEQLCINYCNERLQTFFNEVIFENEKKIYEAEGIDCDDIRYQDNIGCVRLVDAKNSGIFALLDEEVVVPRGSDAKFVSRLHTTFDETAATKSTYYVRNRRKPNDFGVRHFAGEVVYSTDGFLEKNKDALSPSLLALLKASSVPIMNVQGAPDAEVVENKATGRKSGKVTEKMTLATKFKVDLDNLMLALQSTCPHFIRCVKPNDAQQPNKFEPVLALRQLKYAGLFEAIHIRKSGYAIRMPLEQFIQRYKHCCTVNYLKTIKEPPSAVCQAILEELTRTIPIVGPPDMKMWGIGTSKVFLRTLKVKHLLEEKRNGAVDIVAVQLQKVARGFIARCRLFAVRKDAIMAKKKQRAIEQAANDAMAKEDAASRALEEEYKTNLAMAQKAEEEKKARIRAEYERIMKVRNLAATRIQKVLRGKWGRSKAKIIKAEVMLARAIKSRIEKDLIEAIHLVDNLQIKSKHVKTMKQNAKDLLLEVEGEEYVRCELQQAIASMSHDMLTNAIKMAEDTNMVYLEELTRAKQALLDISSRREVLKTLQSVLSRCDSVPHLLAHTDMLDQLVMSATALGLGGEFSVQDTVLRCQRIKRLINIRNDIRNAVELCSITKMQAAIQVRNTLVPIYGVELCAEEVEAVKNMMRMFSLNALVPCENDDDCQDSRLPPFVREQLDAIRSAPNDEEREKATEKLHLLVPSAEKRRYYMRLFKWVVSFATWKYDSETAELIPETTETSSKSSTSRKAEIVESNVYLSPKKGVRSQFNASASLQYRTRKIKTAGGGDLSAVMSPEKTTTFIPFSQRQSKTAVAAYSAMKKKTKQSGGKTEGGKAERLLQDTMRDYDKFYNKHKGETGWQL